jgi:Arc/MetJ-type ribon-helix-helix transcriptional regulator
MACSVSVGARYEKLAEYLITIGRYENRSEVFRHAMRLLEDYEYGRGYIYRSEEAAVLISAYARLNNAEREVDYPRRRNRNELARERRPEVIKTAKEYVEARIDRDAELQPKAPPARFDPPDNPETSQPRQKTRK